MKVMTNPNNVVSPDQTMKCVHVYVCVGVHVCARVCVFIDRSLQIQFPLYSQTVLHEWNEMTVLKV